MPKDLNTLVLERRSDLTNCAGGKPLITFGGGDAPVLDYRMPQSTSFDTYSPVKLVVNEKCWSAKALKVYPNAYANLTPSQISAVVAQNSSQVVDAKQPITNLLRAVAHNLQAMDDSVLRQAKDKADTKPSPTPEATPDTVFQLFKNGYTARFLNKFNGKEQTLLLEQRPTQANPTLFVLHKYKTKSFLGNYGAGQTISTFSLLPGEKTTIIIKSFKEISEVKTSSSNIVDSFSKESADEMENLLEAETSTNQSNSNTGTLTTNEGKTRTAEAHFDVNASFKIAGQGGSASAGGSINGTNSSNTTNTVSTSATSAQNAKDLHKALEKHVNKSNANRTHTIQQSDTTSSKETYENTTTREIVNPNIGRVLNFVFRNLNQGYKVLTSLEEIKIGFTNGQPESEIMVDISQLDFLLNEVLKNDAEGEKCKQTLRDYIFCQYGTVTDYNGVERPFIQPHTEDKPCGNISYFRKIPKLQYFYNTVTDETITKEQADDKGVAGILKLAMNGVILNADEFVLKTDAVIIDALLGHASALDCFNANVQEEKKNELLLNNLKQELAFETLKQIADPIKRAEMYAEMFNPRQTISKQ